MKFILFITLIFFMISCNEVTQKEVIPEKKVKDETQGISYSKNDLQKLKWIEGSWKGMYNNQPFFEIYKLTDDSTLEVTSYDWNGKDSSNTSRTYVRWIDSSYYFGEQMNWKVVSITDRQITMKRNYKASNDIIWKFYDANSWDAILEKPKGEEHYHMERVRTLDDDRR
jgi:hypothetical protein